MKKTMIVLAVVTMMFAACDNSANTQPATTDSTTVKVDSVKVDSAKVDTTKSK